METFNVLRVSAFGYLYVFYFGTEKRHNQNLNILLKNI